MTIGQLYNASNVLVGQAAVFVAPKDTPLPLISATVPNMADPYDPTPWTSYHLAPGSATSVIFSYNGVAGSSLTLAATTPSLIQANIAAIAGVGVGNVTVASDGGTGFNIVLTPSLIQNGTLTYVPTGGSGSSLTGPLWFAPGATDQGWSYTANKSTTDIAIEEQSTPVATTIASQSVQITGSLSEDIVQTLALAFNGITTKTAAAVGNPGYSSTVLTDTPILYAVALVTINAFGFPRWIYAPRWTQLSNAAVAFRRSSSKRMYPVTFQTLCQPSQIAQIDFNAPHS